MLFPFNNRNVYTSFFHFHLNIWEVKVRKMTTLTPRCTTAAGLKLPLRQPRSKGFKVDTFTVERVFLTRMSVYMCGFNPWQWWPCTVYTSCLCTLQSLWNTGNQDILCKTYIFILSLKGSPKPWHSSFKQNTLTQHHNPGVSRPCPHNPARFSVLQG